MAGDRRTDQGRQNPGARLRLAAGDGAIIEAKATPEPEPE
jgi:hypothetical protein